MVGVKVDDNVDQMRRVSFEHQRPLISGDVCQNNRYRHQVDSGCRSVYKT